MSRISLTALPALVLVLKPRFLSKQPSVTKTSSLTKAAALVLGFCLLGGTVASAQNAEPELPSGDELAQRINARDEGEHLSSSFVLIERN